MNAKYRKFILLTNVIGIASVLSSATYANNFNMNSIVANASRQMSAYTLDCAHWYVGANLGVSHLYDSRAPRSRDSMNENGPGWNANVGYQFNALLGGELGYTQYHDSRETLGTASIAKTEHYGVYLAATGRYPLIDKFNLVAKLGVGYGYANKNFTAATAAKSANSVSPYYGLGVSYSVTPRVDFILQWARLRGNNYTGSADLYSLGATFAIV